MIFFDIDGTLITEDKNRILPKTTVEAIRKTRENGNLVFINTGRVFINIDKFIKNIGFDGYVCGCGTYIVFNDKILFHNRLSKELCREVAYKSREFKLCNLYEEADHVGIDKDFSYNEDLKDLQNNLKVNMFVGDEDFVFD